MPASGTLPRLRRPWYSEETGFFGSRFLEEYAPWMTAEETRRQAAFLGGVLQSASGKRVLDLACGTGRHAVELTSLGFEVRGLDLNRSLLSKARSSSGAADADPQWIQADMRALPFDDQSFDAVVSMFTSFGFFDRESDDDRVLEQVSRVVKAGGIFVIDLMNPDFVLSRFKSIEERRGEDGRLWIHRRSFDPETGRFHHRRAPKAGAEAGSAWETAVRLYPPERIQDRLERAAFRVGKIYGGYRYEPSGPDQPRMILVSEKRT